jgi:hypothetical protein
VTDDQSKALAAEVRHAWQVAVGALAPHRRGCLYCQHQQPCAEYAVLDAAERDAWIAYEQGFQEARS